MMAKPVSIAWRTAPLALALLLCAAPASALYKVVQPDGTVTYTDRPPTDDQPSRVTPLGRSGDAQGARERSAPGTAAGDRPPPGHAVHDRGLRAVRQRAQAAAAAWRALRREAHLERLVGGRSVPALTIGAQPLRGFSATDWGAFLDAAGYPRTSRLPRDWPTPAVTPLTERAAVVPAAAAPATAPRPAPAAEPQPTTGIRF
jgi:hypothetical protein